MYYPLFKRVFDFTAALLGLILFSPVLIIISLLVLIYHGIPILYTQKRPGHKERIFKIYKFRSMTNKKDELGVLLADENRITRLGKVLRKTSLDELPELINVIRGDMSLVGPRPLLVSYLPYYLHEEKKRHSIKPGITGLAQVSGRNYINWDKRLALDIEYVENMSFKLDLKILIKTFFNITLLRDVSVNSSKVEPSLIDYRLKKLKE